MKKNKTLILLFVFFMSGISSFAQSETEVTPQTATPRPIQLDENIDKPLLSGLYNITTIGVLGGSYQNRQAAPFSFQSLMMLPLNDHFAFGAGLGIEFLEETYMPLVMDLRYYLRGTRFSPFVFVQSGYSISTTKKASQDIIYTHYDIWPGPYPEYTDVNPLGGFLVNPGFGIRHMFHDDFGMELSFSLRRQQLNYKSGERTRIEKDYYRLNFRIGILFK